MLRLYEHAHTNSRFPNSDHVDMPVCTHKWDSMTLFCKPQISIFWVLQSFYNWWIKLSIYNVIKFTIVYRSEKCIHNFRRCLTPPPFFCFGSIKSKTFNCYDYLYRGTSKINVSRWQNGRKNSKVFFGLIMKTKKRRKKVVTFDIWKLYPDTCSIDGVFSLLFCRNKDSGVWVKAQIP